jgi:hypothetical protein
MVERRRMSRRTALASFAGAVAGAVALPVMPAWAAQPTTAGLNMLPLQISNVIQQNGGLWPWDRLAPRPSRCR